MWREILIYQLLCQVLFVLKNCIFNYYGFFLWHYNTLSLNAKNNTSARWFYLKQYDKLLSKHVPCVEPAAYFDVWGVFVCIILYLRHYGDLHFFHNILRHCQSKISFSNWYAYIVVLRADAIIIPIQYHNPVLGRVCVRHNSFLPHSTVSIRFAQIAYANTRFRVHFFHV